MSKIRKYQLKLYSTRLNTNLKKLSCFCQKRHNVKYIFEKFIIHKEIIINHA